MTEMEINNNVDEIMTKANTLIEAFLISVVLMEQQLL